MKFNFLPTRDIEENSLGNVLDNEKMKNFLNCKNPALWVTATVAAACVIPVVLTLRSPKRKAKDILDCQLSVKEIAYQAPFYSFTYIPDQAPTYQFLSDQQLFVKDDFLTKDYSKEWRSLGTMELVKLTEANFDDLFFTGQDRLFPRIRRKNLNTWQLDISGDPDSIFYYLMQQKNGDVYLAYGYRTDGQNNLDSRGCIVRWLFLMNADEIQVISKD